MKDKKPEWMTKQYSTDNIRAINAKFEAQKIAFAPLTFQAAYALQKTGILKALLDSGDEGVAFAELLENHELDEYGLKLLLEMGLSMEMVKWKSETETDVYIIGKVGFFLEADDLTRANMEFAQDVCYLGAFSLLTALKSGKPEGLKVFGDWDTIYQGLSELPEQVQHSWFQFDHYYSDNAFPAALDFIFATPHRRMMDIGGNTAKWAIACSSRDPEVKVTIVDLPGQAGMARKRIADRNLQNRISVYESDMLNPESGLPEGCDAVWMSQFLDCFSLPEVTAIAQKVVRAIDEKAEVFVMEPLWDRQKYPAAAYSLHATSLYFTAMANGNSKMYGYKELVEAVERGGLKLTGEVHELGPNDYSILRFSRR